MSSLGRLRLALVGETTFPPRAPFFFWTRLSQRAPQVGAQPEDRVWGNLPVPPEPPPQLAHRPEAGR
jgi:hypothetical protein